MDRVCQCEPNRQIEHYSFVNGIYTLKGGKHVDVISKQITSKLVAMIEKRHKKTVRNRMSKII